MALHGAIMSISFLYTTYIEPAAPPPYIAHLYQYFATYFHTMRYYIMQNVKNLKPSFVPSMAHHYFLYKPYIAYYSIVYIQ